MIITDDYKRKLVASKIREYAFDSDVLMDDIINDILQIIDNKNPITCTKDIPNY